MYQYDYLLVGSGLYSGVFAYLAAQKGKKCLVLEKRTEIGGNLRCRILDHIPIHEYGAHIFHTDNKKVWDFICNLVEVRPFINSPVANYKGEIYNLPFNMNTFSKMWGITKPEEAKEIINKQRSRCQGIPENLEQQALQLVGKDIYEKLIKGYTEKQWGRDCKELPSFIIKRIPVRYTYNNNYFNDIYQGIPYGGYNRLINRLFENADVLCNIDFNKDRERWKGKAKNIIYTGMIDAYFDFCYGELEYRSLRFESSEESVDNYQGVAVMNFTDKDTPYTRVIEHKHFEGTSLLDIPKTIISREYPEKWKSGMEPYYPVNDEKNNNLYKRYQQLSKVENRIYFGGRLGEYKYFDMDKTIAAAMELAENIL